MEERAQVDKAGIKQRQVLKSPKMRGGGGYTWLQETEQGSRLVAMPGSPGFPHLTRRPALERFPWQSVRLQPAFHLQDQRGEHLLSAHVSSFQWVASALAPQPVHGAPGAHPPSSLAVPDDFPPLHRSLRGGGCHAGLTGESVLPLPGRSPPPGEDVGAEDNRGGGHGRDRARARVIFWHISADDEFGP